MKRPKKIPKWLHFVEKDDGVESLQAAVDDNPFTHKPKWTVNDGVLIHAALSFFGRMLTEDKNGARWHMATSAEAFGCQPGERMPDEKQLERVVAKVFSILTKRNRKKVAVAMHDLIFWPNFKGGFIHATHSPTY